MSCLSFLTYVLMMFFLFIVPAASSKGDHRVPSKHVALFVFGDSVFDPGNNQFRNIPNDSKANFWPYGETFFHFPTGRYTDGRILPDFLSICLKIPLWKPYLAPGKHYLLHGANFASGGAAVLPEYSYEGPASFSEQLSYFEDVAGLLKKQIGDEEAKKMLTEAVYLSSIGGIDLLASEVYINGTQAQRQELVNMVIGNITLGIKKIYAVGGRKFAFQNVGPLGCMPAVRQEALQEGFNSSDACYEELLNLATLHNDALAKANKELETQLPGFKYLIYDYYNFLLDRMKNPAEYGFKEGFIGCCGNGTFRGSGCGVKPYELCSEPSEYVWFDGGHPTEHAYAQLAKLVWKGGPKATKPFNMKQLFELD
ncbi:hypothetical protein P3X46_001653 [Hevea brasiliensis]|uniref:GDSL esterase/lipase 1-like n=1 Tax=Hevea brasiliensis TaxID=3981 RepID=A0ABQ9NDN8_HEVBR|nr:hypothetical protein P3X46_001653 [Hevea brasiliensis]